MTVRSLTCPKCRASINVPAAMQTARCSACGQVFAVAGAAAASSAASGDAPTQSSSATSEPASNKTDDISINPTMIYMVGGGVLTLLLIAGVVGFLVFSPTNSEVEKTQPTVSSEPVLRKATPEELAALKIVKIPEEQRRRIYDDMRKTAKITTEKPLMLPDSPVRSSLEGMLGGTYDYSIKQLAAMHDLSEQDIRDIVTEGDLKNWDPSARSRAYRDGERIYDDERTGGS